MSVMMAALLISFVTAIQSQNQSIPELRQTLSDPGLNRFDMSGFVLELPPGLKDEILQRHGSGFLGYLTEGNSDYIPESKRNIPCSEDTAFQLLDFWLGEWDVFIQNRHVGTNSIKKILNGCAIHEYWTDARSQQGHGLFYYQKATELWKHIWITENATERGGVKEKQLVGIMDDGSVQFQGEIPLNGLKSYLDRTTLTPLPDGHVRQLIEISTDGGESWRSIFDAIYIRNTE